MRVLMIAHELPSSRNATTDAPIAKQVESLRKCGVDVDVVQLVGRKKIKYLQAYPRFQRGIRRDVDLIHAHYGFCGMMARTQWRKPVVVSFMGSDILGTPDDEGKLDPKSRVEILANRCLAHFVDAIIVKSAQMARVLAPLKVNIVPNGVDFDLFSPMEKKEARRILGWPDGPHYILFPGDPQVPRKGFPFARDAVQLAAEKMKATIEVKTLYQVPHQQVPLLMNACDLTVMTSYIEGSPNVVKEAMACNRPILGVPVGDVVELLDNVSGCMVIEREKNTFAEAVVDMLNHPVAAEGRERLTQKGMDLESVAQKIIAIYESVIDQKYKEKR